MNYSKTFSFGELTSNSSGKTSGSGSMGILICTIGCICFLIGAIDAAFITHSTNIILQSIIFTGIGAGLLGYRKSKASQDIVPDSNDTTNDIIKDANVTNSQPLNS